jgi:hypothetical protein
LGWVGGEGEGEGRLETSWHGYMVFSLDGGFLIGTCRGFASLISLVMGWRRTWGFNQLDCRGIGIFLFALLLTCKRVFSVARLQGLRSAVDAVDRATWRLLLSRRVCEVVSALDNTSGQRVGYFLLGTSCWSHNMSSQSNIRTWLRSNVKRSTKS